MPNLKPHEIAREIVRKAKNKQDIENDYEELRDLVDQEEARRLIEQAYSFNTFFN